MGWLEQLQSFYNHIEDFSERKLRKSNLTKVFLEFMKEKYGYNNEYFSKGFAADDKKYSDYDDYLYKHYIGLDMDLSNEYSRLLSKAKERVREYKAKVSELSKKIAVETEKYTKQKYIFIKEINEDLLKKAKEARENKNLVRKAIRNCDKLYRSLSGFFRSEDMYFWNYEQYENFDWKMRINFGEASVGDVQKILKLKLNNRTEYMQVFKQYIGQHQIIENALELTRNNFYLHDRIVILEEAMRMFNENKNAPFVYLLVTQIEGLFDVYRNILGIGNAKNYSGLSEKLEDIQEKKRIWGYVYFAFEFPKLRNEIAHGQIIPVDEEDACDILMDVFHIIKDIDSDELPYKIAINFFAELSKTNDENAIHYVLNYFTRVYKDRNMLWLKNFLNGEYHDELIWYGFAEKVKQFIILLNSNEFRTAIYDNEPLIINKNIEMDSKKFNVIEINTGVLNYLPLLDILKEKISFPIDWINEIDKRKQEIIEEKRKHPIF